MDRCRTGHQCSRTAPVLARQYTVFANGKPLLIKGDRVAPHFIKAGLYCVPHSARLKGSSRSVFVNNIGVGRRGDRADFGRMIGSSQNVFAG